MTLPRAIARMDTLRTGRKRTLAHRLPAFAAPDIGVAHLAEALQYGSPGFTG